MTDVCVEKTTKARAKRKGPSASAKDASSLLRPPWFYLSQVISHSKTPYLHSEKDFLRSEKAFYNAVKACNVVNPGLAVSV